MRMIVVRDADGTCINIGPWDHQYEEVATGLLGADGRPVTKQVARNPYPEGATEKKEDVIVDDSGRRPAKGSHLSQPDKP